MDSSFDCYGPPEPRSPVVVSVPHAGRDYPLTLRSALRGSVDSLLPLEDRLVDEVARAAHGHETLIIARRARAWIDLNRAEHERDPRIDEGADASAAPHPSAKVRSGLGLIPRRATGSAELWRRRWSADEVAQRIHADHRPYHARVAAALAAARARYGTAVLVDLHSMPSLGTPNAARVVIGDRFGRSAGGGLIARLEATARAHRLPVTLNTPYAGGHILDRHAAPARGIHAVQIELDRAVYLDAVGRALGPGFARTVAFVRDLFAAAADDVLPALAAE
ncbi:N-formylglutamate amidohydrolase [Sphingomonas guangdongensis]|uniref:N-formylglutamate amidohydrolase n=1 Tax=Sphingomonas guangdongensis TaxID=1141890 RepID=A0A285R235_9SPHN|nr:N-formylglutamate amidohydrolase [Sphingomonas guangdongensis]SOB88155.1 N-formylglutamate amidohydrolase [Sphingomonas guangdongensis]